MDPVYTDYLHSILFSCNTALLHLYSALPAQNTWTKLMAKFW